MSAATSIDWVAVETLRAERYWHGGALNEATPYQLAELVRFGFAHATASDVSDWRAFLHDYVTAKNPGADVTVIAAADTGRTHVRAWDGSDDDATESQRADIAGECDDAWTAWCSR